MLGLYDFLQGAAPADMMVTKAIIHSDDKGSKIKIGIEDATAEDEKKGERNWNVQDTTYGVRTVIKGLDSTTKLKDIKAGEELKSWGFKVQFNPATITMSTTNSSNKNNMDKEPNSDTSLVGDSEENREKQIATKEKKNKPVRTGREPDIGKKRVEVTMQLTFDELSRWDELFRKGYINKENYNGTSKILSAEFQLRQGGFKGLMKAGVKSLTGGNYDEILTQLNLHNENSPLSCLEQAFYTKQYVVFQWGPMRFRGVISRFNTNYTVFSPGGSPLRATVDFGLSLDTKDIDLENGKTGVDFSTEYKESKWLERRATFSANIHSIPALIARFTL